MHNVNNDGNLVALVSSQAVVFDLYCQDTIPTTKPTGSL